MNKTLVNAILCLLLCFGSLILEAKKNDGTIQYWFQYKEDRKLQMSDTLSIQLIAFQNESCFDGVDKTKIFGKGIKIIKQSKWTEKEHDFWMKQISVVLKGNRKQEVEITAYRKTDKGVFVQTKKITITDDNK